MKIFAPALASLAFAAFVSGAQATTINETTDFTTNGDWSFGVPVSTPALSFATLGAHSVTGSLSTTCNIFGADCTGDTADIFTVFLDSGQAVESIVFTVLNATAISGGSPVTGTPTFNTIVDAGGVAFGLQNISGNGTADYTNSFTLVPLNGNYSFGIQVPVAPGFTEGVTADWRMDIVIGPSGIAPVPLPASSLLLLGGFAGLGALGAARRRKRVADPH